MPNYRHLTRILAGSLLVALAGAAVADEDGKSLTQKLIEADGKLALQKLELDLSKNAPAPAVVAASVVPTKSTERQAPQTIALYGVDGTAAGGALSLRSYVKWGETVYPAKVGAKWRGYTITAITEAGTTFSRGKAKVFAPTVLDDAAVLFEQKPTEQVAAVQPRPASPIPSGLAPSVAPSILAPLPLPAAPVPLPPAAPVAPAVAPAVAQR